MLRYTSCIMFKDSSCNQWCLQPNELKHDQSKLTDDSRDGHPSTMTIEDTCYPQCFATNDRSERKALAWTVLVNCISQEQKCLT